ncbi:hypothetical protein [Pedobacter xixiisoli]|uniref:Uncharacterized protein n=1 Tax=Pedobacter xixiisoli TaxID=1476464 RepID=A0A285ZSN3_9SPHI|nr:hypothetical protein [Pedobacter xixiisoli]SOD12646.1 hypothetical protein SAMN06297358_0775 [Pedobacter xixiisoli]
MEKKKIISGQRPEGTTDKSYEMNGSHTFSSPSEKINIKSSEELADHYDRDETCNSKYDKGEKH